MPDTAVSAPTASGARRRPQWRGDRRPVTARVPVPVAEALGALARQRGCSLSDAAADLIGLGLRDHGVTA